MSSTKEFSGIASEDIQQAALSDDNDFRLGMSEIGKSVTLLWPTNDDLSRFATRLAGMVQEIVGEPTTGGSRDEVTNKEE